MGALPDSKYLFFIMSKAFDLGPFWKTLSPFLHWLKGRLEYGQTEIEGAKIDVHIQKAVLALRSKVIKDGLEQRGVSQPLTAHDAFDMVS